MPLPPFSNEMLLTNIMAGFIHVHAFIAASVTFYNCLLASLELEVTITKFHFCTGKCIAGAVCCCFFYKNYTAMFAITNFGVVIEKHLD